MGKIKMKWLEVRELKAEMDLFVLIVDGGCRTDRDYDSVVGTNICDVQLLALGDKPHF